VPFARRLSQNRLSTNFACSDYERAIAEYRLALAADPTYREVWHNLAEAALLKGSELIAHDAIRQLEGLNPSHPALPRLRSELSALRARPAPTPLRP